MICDDDVIELLKGTNSLLDAYLLKVHIRDDANGTGSITLKFRPRFGSDFSEISLRFDEVMELEFRSNDGTTRGNVEDLKFLKSADRSYRISLDPDPSTLPAAGVGAVQACDSDNFVVRARHVEAAVTLR